MNQCTECGSMAINLNMDGRDGSNPHLCDVCHWRSKLSDALTVIARLRKALAKANDQAERFERHWYLRGDALEDCIPALEIGLDAARVICAFGDDRPATIRDALAKARAALAEVPQ